MAIRRNFSVFRGEDRLLIFRPDPLNIVPITGWPLKLYMRDYAGKGTTPTLSATGVIVDADAGVFTVLLVRSATILLSTKNYYYDVWKEEVDNNIVLVYGMCEVKPQARDAAAA